MSREWKPGDVAAVSFDGFEDEVFLGVLDMNDDWTRIGPCGDDEPRWLSDGDRLSARPLAVIDPEDAQQMRALGKAWDDLADKHAELTDEPMTLSALRMQAVLREFANPAPPKPDEPMGLGAVVVDHDGKRWVRNNPRGPASWSPENAAADGIAFPYRSFDGIDAVRVLSPGVEADDA